MVMTEMEAVFEERRIKARCRITKQTKYFVILWPLLLSFTYFTDGFWPTELFSNRIDDIIYSTLALVVSAIGIFATIFWQRMVLRNIMTSIALARSASVVALAIVEEPPLPFGSIMKLTGAGILAVIFFSLAIVEIPFIKAMSYERN